MPGGSQTRISGMLVAGTFCLFAASAGAQEEATSVRGIVKAVNQASISSELGFRIVEMPFREGQEFRKGDALVTFDCEGLRAELRAAEARQIAERLTYENNERLARLNAVGRFEVQLAKAKADQAAAETDAFRIKLDQCVIKAPFNGRVAIKAANVAELAEPARPMMQIISDDALEIEMLLPAHWLRWLKTATPFTLNLEENGMALEAAVTEIAPMVDPVSQTIKVIGTFARTPEGVLPGMSGPVIFAGQEN